MKTLMLYFKIIICTLLLYTLSIWIPLQISNIRIWLSNKLFHWYLDGKLHREGGPAIDYPLGEKHWYLHGERHREGGPAIEYPNGAKRWYLNGKLHREDGPAIEEPNGTKWWYQNGELIMKEWSNGKKEYGKRQWRIGGKLHREDGPAVEWFDGKKEWYLHDRLHREGGPAIEWPDGRKEWYQNGELHRYDGPAIESSNGNGIWYLFGHLHRMGGPAVEGPDGTKEWHTLELFYFGDTKARWSPHSIGKSDAWWIDGGNESNSIDVSRSFDPKHFAAKQFSRIRMKEWPDGKKEWYSYSYRFCYIWNIRQVTDVIVEWPSGKKEWYTNFESHSYSPIDNKRHREDGPAIERPDGTKEWYFYGKKLSLTEYVEAIDRLKISHGLYLKDVIEEERMKEVESARRAYLKKLGIENV